MVTKRGLPPALVAWGSDFDPDTEPPALDPEYYEDTQLAYISNVRYRNSLQGWASGERFSERDNVAVRRLFEE